MKKTNNLPHLVACDPRYFLAFGFGAGLSPFAPGTCGTLAAIPIYLMLSHVVWPLYLLFVVIAFFVGVRVCDEISNELKKKDYPGIVWDECVGYWITMFLAPRGWGWIALGFVLFRFFDILKPAPIRQVDRNSHSGFSVMFDDVLAAIYAWMALQLIIWWMGVSV